MRGRVVHDPIARLGVASGHIFTKRPVCNSLASLGAGAHERHDNVCVPSLTIQEIAMSSITALLAFIVDSSTW